MKTHYKILIILAAVFLSAAVPVYQSYTPFANIRVRNDAQLNTMTVSGAANFDGAMDFDGALDMGTNVISNIGNAGTDFGSNGGLTLANSLTLSNGETISNGTDGIISLVGGLGLSTVHITGTTELTPTLYTHYVVNSSAEITLTLNACATAGQPLVLYGDDANTVNVADSNIRTGDGNAITFNQYDNVLLMCNGTEWGVVADVALQ